MDRRLVCVLFLATLLLCAQWTDAKVKKKKIAARAALLKNVASCAVDEDCPYTACHTTTCLSGICVDNKVVCPASSNPCTYSLGCDALSDQCRYSELECDDANPCTVDQCARNNSDHSYCVHTRMPGCDDSSVHSVTFRVENANHLNIAVHSDKLIEFCQSSTLVSPESSIVIGFDQYIPCKLHERGTCDNKLSFAATPSYVRFVDTFEMNGDPACNVEAGYDAYTLAINRVSRSLRWSLTEDPTFTPLPMKDGHQIHGYLIDTENPGLVLRVDITLRENAMHTVSKELSSNCYDVAGIDPILWSTYEITSGTLTAAHDTQYMGLVFSVTGGSAQIGHGASGRNQEWGMLMNLNLEIANQPHDPQLELNIYRTEAIMRTNLVQKAEVPVDYCSLFDEPNMVTTNDWFATYTTAAHTVSYCRNFTLNELLKCRSYGNKYASLFQAINADIEDDEHVNFAGTIYQTTVQPRSECSAWTEGTCGERIISSSSYNITIISNASGVRRVELVHSDFEFNIKWIENRWICCDSEDSGNLRVIVETEVSGEKRKLINPRVNFAEETGYPLKFDTSDVPDCDKAYTDRCVQRWSLVTVDGGNVVDFSGVKPLLWDIFERQSIIAHVTAMMTLRARHVGSQTHLDNGRVSAELSIFTDRNLQSPVDTKRTPDGTPLFASVCLTDHRHLHIIPNEVAVCYSHKRDLEDEQCDEKVVLFSRHGETSTNASVHSFEFITNPPITSHCFGFSLLTRAYTKHRQTMYIDYSVQESTGDGGLIELWHDDDDEDDDDWHHHSYYSYHSYCPHSHAFDWDHYHCHEFHDDDGTVVFVLLVLFGILGFFAIWCLISPPSYKRKKKRMVHDTNSEDEVNAFWAQSDDDDVDSAVGGDSSYAKTTRKR